MEDKGIEPFSLACKARVINQYTNPPFLVETINTFKTKITFIKMSRKRTWTNDQLVKAVASNFSIASVLRDLGLKVTGANYGTVHRTVKELNLSTSHWTGQGHLRGKTHNWNAVVSLETALVENSPYVSTYNLKKRLLKAGLLAYNCSECGINTWQDRPLALQLDHRNGINNDNRLENLRLLCPNCHSQTETFAGKNKSRSRGIRTLMV